jgi:hypothetical protein
MAEATQTANRGEDRIPWGWVVVTALGLEIALIISAVAWVVIYSYLIHPGEDQAYYENHAKFSSPIVALVVGMPFWFFACRWVTRKAGTRAVQMALWVWLIIFIIDMPLIVFGKPRLYDWVIVALAYATKLLAAYLGGRAALKHAS